MTHPPTHSMAGLDPAIQGRTWRTQSPVSWMAASEDGHGVGGGGVHGPPEANP